MLQLLAAATSGSAGGLQKPALQAQAKKLVKQQKNTKERQKKKSAKRHPHCRSQHVKVCRLRHVSHSCLGLEGMFRSDGPRLFLLFGLLCFALNGGHVTRLRITWRCLKVLLTDSVFSLSLRVSFVGSLCFRNCRQVMEKSWEATQIKTFTRWMNTFLTSRSATIEDIQKDLEDGVGLCYLVIELTKKELGRINTTPKLPFNKIENLNKALTVINQFAAAQGLKLQYSAESVMQGDLKQILGLTWVLIHRWAIEEVSEENSTAKDGLLLWCKKKTHGYANVNVTNFTDSWASGLAFCALIHRHQPQLINYGSLHLENPSENLELAFRVAEQELGIPRLLDVEDMTNAKPDEKSVMTYLSYYWKRFASMSKAQGASACLSSLLGKLLAVEEALNKYVTGAQDVSAWAASQFTTEVPQSFEDLRAYRLNAKIQHESSLFDLQNLYTLYSSNPAFVMDESLVPSALQQQWSDMCEREQAFEDQLKKAGADARRRKQLESKFRTGEQAIEQWLTSSSEEIAYDASTLSSVSAAKRQVHALSEQCETMKQRAAALRELLSAEERPSQAVDTDLPAAEQKTSAQLAELTALEEELSARDKRQSELASELQSFHLWVEDHLAMAREPVAVDTVEEADVLASQVGAVAMRSAPDDSGLEGNPYTKLTAAGLQQKLQELETALSDRKTRIAQAKEFIVETQTLCDAFTADAKQFLDAVEATSDQKVLSTEVKERLDKLSEENFSILSRGYAGDLKPSLQACSASYKERMRVLDAAREAAEQEALAGKLSQEVLQELQDAFRFFDKDNSGTMNKEEMSAVFQSLGEEDSSDQVWKHFNLADSQDITFAQFTEVMQDKYTNRSQSTSKENVTASFKAIAGENAEEGLITEEALRAAMPGPEADQLLKRLAPVEGRTGVYSYVAFVHSAC